MNQEPNHYEIEGQKAAEATKKLKKRMMIVIICMVVFAVVAMPLISVIDQYLTGEGNEPETEKRPPSSIIFAEIDYEEDIMKDREYLALDRSLYYHDERAGTMEVLDQKTLLSRGPAVIVLSECIDSIIMGDAEAYNALFSDNYYEKNEPEAPFTMQRLYDIHISLVNQTNVNPESGKAYTQYEFEVWYKIRLNNGTYRTDIGHDESRKQYFVLSDSTGDEVLIDQILNFNYQ